MTTYTNFAPTPQAPFQFQAVLDGAPYTIIVTWLAFGQRWYVNCYDQNNNLIFCLPLIGSADGLPLSALSWASGLVTATTGAPHGFRIGSAVQLTLTGTSPDGFNGSFLCSVLNTTQFSYLVANDPGPIATLGAASYNVNLAAGYFQTSTLVFRTSTQNFEVTP